MSVSKDKIFNVDCTLYRSEYSKKGLYLPSLFTILLVISILKEKLRPKILFHRYLVRQTQRLFGLT